MATVFVILCDFFWKIKIFGYNYVCLFCNIINMSKRNRSPENIKSNNNKKSGGWKKVTTAAALWLALTACDNISNDEIIFNPENQSARFKVEYQYYRWSQQWDIVDYDISVSKQWDTYMWLIKEIDGWKSKKTTVEADNVDEVFDGISRALDNYQIKDETAFKKDKKVNFVKKEFKDKVLNADNSSQIDEITIKYKSE